MSTASALRESQTILRERSFPVSNEVMIFVRALQQHLGLSRSTGMLCVDINQGGVGTVRFKEQQGIARP